MALKDLGGMTLGSMKDEGENEQGERKRMEYFDHSMEESRRVPLDFLNETGEVGEFFFRWSEDLSERN